MKSLHATALTNVLVKKGSSSDALDAPNKNQVEVKALTT